MHRLRILAMAMATAFLASTAAGESRISAGAAGAASALSASAGLRVVLVVAPTLRLTVVDDPGGAPAANLVTNGGSVLRACGSGPCRASALGTSGVNRIRVIGASSTDLTIAQP